MIDINTINIVLECIKNMDNVEDIIHEIEILGEEAEEELLSSL